MHFWSPVYLLKCTLPDLEDILALTLLQFSNISNCLDQAHFFPKASPISHKAVKIIIFIFNWGLWTKIHKVSELISDINSSSVYKSIVI